MSEDKESLPEELPSQEVSLPPRKALSGAYKKKMLENAVFTLQNQSPFYGSLLQEITIKYNEYVPTAGITYNQKMGQYEVFVNPTFFDSLVPKERAAVFEHELQHFTNKHLFRMPFMDKEVSDDDKRLYNIAGDMSINQYIKHLPADCVDYKAWKLDDGSVFPSLLSMEQYFELIKEEDKNQKQKNKDAGEGKGKPSDGNVPDQLGKYKPFDQHDWDSLDEETKKRMLDEARKVLRRTIEKTTTGYSSELDKIKDLLVEIDALSTKLDCKSLLKRVIKRTVSCVDRERTWNRPSKRFGVFAPGTKVGNLPNLSIYADSSGSISHTEMNVFFKVISQFLKVGNRNCWLGLWHTELYYKKKYKLNAQLAESELESGGTDVSCVIEDIKKTNPNLAIILTDGYYSAVDIKVGSEVLWIISEGGSDDHPNKHIGKTIRLEDLK